MNGITRNSVLSLWNAALSGRRYGQLLLSYVSLRISRISSSACAC